MASAAVLIAFCVALVCSMVAKLSITVPLFIGFLLFFGYGLAKRNSFASLLKASLEGIWSIRNILIAFLLIGMLTASWRAGGTIPAIVTACAHLITPSVYYLASFLMVSLVAILTGTSFGTAATMGTISMALGTTLGCNPVIVAGTILSGAYLGDRWSPLSTSALLTAEVTGTKVMDNLPLMAKRAVVPIILSALVYLALGFALPAASDAATLSLPYGAAFDLGIVTFVPAASVILLALMKADVKVNMAVSTVLAIAVALLVQGVEPAALLKFLVVGYTSSNADIAATLSGGGIVSMLGPAAIILISSTYAGLFKKTGLLDGLKAGLGKFSQKLSREVAITIATVPLCCLACNQTLSTMLAQQLMEPQYPNQQELALDIEDTVIVMCALVPWCIAAAVPLATVGAPATSILFACYLYLTPLWMIVRSAVKRRASK